MEERNRNKYFVVQVKELYDHPKLKVVKTRTLARYEAPHGLNIDDMPTDIDEFVEQMSGNAKTARKLEKLKAKKEKIEIEIEKMERNEESD